jgi:excisionase family DNA binding protein
MSHETQANGRSVTKGADSKRGRRLLPISEVLARLACGKTTFYEYVKTGRLPIVKLGASTRVSEEVLDRFIESLTSGAAAKETPTASSHAGAKQQ